MPGAVVEMVGLRHRFESRSGDVTVLDGVDLHLDAGEHAALVGASGVGKTTLLAVLGGLVSPQAGIVRVDGLDLAGLSRSELASFRRETVGFVFQHFGLLEALTAAENVELAGALAGVGSGARRRRAAELLDAVGLADRTRHRPLELSGGERQRVAIARALMNGPRLVLADEPTGNLDEGSSTLVMGVLESLPAGHGCTLVVVTHDTAIAARARRCFRLTGGRAVEEAVAV